MNKSIIRTPDGARKIIEDNIQILYYLPDGYKYLNIMLKDTKKELLKVLQYIKDIKPIIWKQKYTWFIPNKIMKDIIKLRATKGTCSRHFNYLCCIGVLKKLPQYKDNMIGINMEFMLENPRKEPMNVITVYRYTGKELLRIEQRAKLLYDNGIKTGNISYSKLCANNCKEIATEVFYTNNPKTMDKKDRELEILLKFIKIRCMRKGYTTKEKIYAYLDLEQAEIEKLFRIYKNQIWENYSYHAPNRLEIDKYNLKNKKWIITKKEEK